MRMLYKYVSAERALTCLPEIGDGTLRATQPAALNDPFECAVWTNSEEVESDKTRENSQVAEILTTINKTSLVKESEVADAREKYGTLYLRELLSRQLSQRFGIVSFAKDPKNPLMWSHYANDGAGFVLGYDWEALKKLKPHKAHPQRVKYGSKPGFFRPSRELDERAIHSFMSQKGVLWKYEKEWRLFVELDETIGTGRNDRHGQPINLLKVPNKAVAKVYYTERTPDKKVREVRKRLKNPNNRYSAKCPTKLVMSEREYGYEEA